MQSRIALMCQTARIKMTPQRKIIADVVSEADDHPDVEEIYRRAKSIDPKMSLATVYRNISIFESHNLITKLEIGDGKARYEQSSPGFCCHHHHLIDMQSGEIIEFSDQELEAIKEKIAARLGYELIDHKLELYGIKLKERSKDS